MEIPYQQQNTTRARLYGGGILGWLMRKQQFTEVKEVGEKSVRAERKSITIFRLRLLWLLVLDLQLSTLNGHQLGVEVRLGPLGVELNLNAHPNALP